MFITTIEIASPLLHYILNQSIFSRILYIVILHVCLLQTTFYLHIITCTYFLKWSFYLRDIWQNRRNNGKKIRIRMQKRYTVEERQNMEVTTRE
jgi:hypothetical protein